MKNLIATITIIFISKFVIGQTTKFFSIQKTNEIGLADSNDKLKYSVNGNSSIGVQDIELDKINTSGGLDIDFLLFSKLKEKDPKQNVYRWFMEKDTVSKRKNYYQIWSNIYGNFNTFNSDSAIYKK